MNKTQKVEVRCTSIEKGLIKQLAQIHGLKVSEYILYLVEQNARLNQNELMEEN